MSETLKSIVVGIDHGARTDNAVRVGLDLSERFGARLALVHAVPPPPSIYASIDTTTLAELEQEVRSSARKKLVAHVEELLGRSGRPRTADQLLRFAHGDPARVLVEEARKADADVIVIGPHQKHGVLDFGRTARGVLAHAPGSVWVQKEEPRPIRRILVPVDLSAPSLRALSLACALARSYEARIEALHCFHQMPIEGIYPEYAAIPPAYTLDDLRRTSQAAFDKEMAGFDWRGVQHETRFVDGEPVATLRSRAGSYDLIVLSTHGRSGLAGVILGNVAYSVLKEARTPVLAMRRP
jgi:nucleotide-binding universal stress UspA family protein